MLGGESIGRTSWFGAGGCAGAGTAAPPGDPPPPGGPPPPGNPPPPGGPPPPPEGPPPPGGMGYFFIALPSALAIRSSFVGAVVVKATVSVGAVVVLIAGMSRSRPCRGGSIAFGTIGLSLILWSIAFCNDSSMSSSVSGRLFSFPLLVVLCSS